MFIRITHGCIIHNTFKHNTKILHYENGTQKYKYGGQILQLKHKSKNTHQKNCTMFDGQLQQQPWVKPKDLLCRTHNKRFYQKVSHILHTYLCLSYKMTCLQKTPKHTTEMLLYCGLSTAERQVGQSVVQLRKVEQKSCRIGWCCLT